MASAASPPAPPSAPAAAAASVDNRIYLVWSTHFESTQQTCKNCHCTETTPSEDGQHDGGQVGCDAHVVTVTISCDKEHSVIAVYAVYMPNCRYPHDNEHADNIPENTTTEFSVDALGTLPKHFDPTYGALVNLTIEESGSGRHKEEWAAFLSSCTKLEEGTPFEKAFYEFSNGNF